MSEGDSDRSSHSEEVQPVAPKKARLQEEEKAKADRDDSDQEDNSDGQEEANSSDVPDDVEADESIMSVIYGLEVELKNNKGKYSLSEKDEGRELKLLVPSDVKQNVLSIIEEKYGKDCIPVLEAQETTVSVDDQDQLVVFAQTLNMTNTFPADKGKQGADGGECIVKIKDYTEYFVTTSLQGDDEDPDE